jgi:hypothetical protein
LLLVHLKKRRAAGSGRSAANDTEPQIDAA